MSKGWFVMKVNYRRTVEKQREAEHQEWLRKRCEMLETMTEEEREEFLEDERQRIKEAFSVISTVQNSLSDTPYSKL